MQSQISSGTIYAPNWNTVRVAKLAARMYAPLGTRMTLGDHVRVTRVFADTFSGRIAGKWEDVKEKDEWGSDRGESVDEEIKPIESDDQEAQQKRDTLAKDLGVSDFPASNDYLNPTHRTTKTSLPILELKMSASDALYHARFSFTGSFFALPGCSYSSPSLYPAFSSGHPSTPPHPTPSGASKCLAQYGTHSTR